MTATRFYVCVRRTLDWGDESAVNAGLQPKFRPKLEAWNATFHPPYHMFRQRLKDIAQESLAAVAGAVHAPLAAIPPGAVVVPVDDDDWLAPELVERLAERYAPGVRGYLWRRAVVEPRVPVRRRLWFWLWSWKASTCSTNDYAIVYRPELGDVIQRHTIAGRYFDAHPSRMVRLPLTLAIQNRNLSSQTAMAFRRPTITREELMRSLDRYRTLYRTFELGGELGWARPYMARMQELMDQVKVR